MFSLSNSEENLSVKNESISPTPRSPMESSIGQEESKDGVSGMEGKRYALRWRHHQSTVVAEVGSLYRDAALVDVTLACEDQRTYQAHKLVLSACSQYFQGLFARHPAHQHPIIFLKDVSGDECEALLTYMYRGEVSVNQDQIPRILRVASSLQVRGLAEVETQSSRPSSPAYGDRSAHCGSSSPSPSTGPPTKCVTPISEPHSPIHPPPLVSPHIQNLTSVAQSLVPQESVPTPPRHLSSLSSALIGSGAPHHPSLPQDFPAFPFHNRHSYNISPSSILGSLAEERKRQEEKNSQPPSLNAPYAPPQLRVKQDLGTNSWESSGVDVGGLSPLPLPDGPRAPFLPHAIFSSFMNSQQDHHHVPTPSQAYGRVFSISDPLRRVDRMGCSGGDTRIHKCQFCSRKFKRKDHLKTHVRIHTGERPYKCKICGRGFIQSQQVKIHMKVHIREDSSGLGSSSLLSGGSSADHRTISALYPDLASHYSDSRLNDRSLRHSRHSQDNSNPDGNVSPSDLHQPHHSSTHSMDTADSDNDYGSEILDSEFDSIKDRTTPQHLLPSSNSSGGRFLPVSASFVPSSSSNPPSPVPINLHNSGRRSITPTSQMQPPLNSSPHEDRTCSAIVMKESYHIATNLKK